MRQPLKMKENNHTVETKKTGMQNMKNWSKLEICSNFDLCVQSENYTQLHFF